MALVITGSSSATAIATAILAAISNITIVGSPTLVSLSNFGTGSGGTNFQAGTFTGGTSIISSSRQLPWDTGVLLSTGSVNAVSANNNSGSTTFTITGTALPSLSPAPSCTARGLGQVGDADLEAMVNAYWGSNVHNRTRDACSLTFSFTALGPTISVDVVFGSDEYTEFINTAFTDAFAIFLDGVNIAKLSDNTIVAINAINSNVADHPEYYTNNPPSGNSPIKISYDGFAGLETAYPLRFTANVSPGTHTIKFVIADVCDGAFDSGVFISAMQSPYSVDNLVETGSCGVSGSQPSPDNISATGACGVGGSQPSPDSLSVTGDCV
jgi:hypothetical protein